MSLVERNIEGLPPRELAIRKLSNFLFWSFNFSQGSQAYQLPIIEFGRSHNAALIANLDEPSKEQIIQKTSQRAYQFYKGKAHTAKDTTSSHDLVLEEVTSFATPLFCLHDVQIPANLAKSVMGFTTDRDYTFLCRRDQPGRPKREPSAHAVVTDPNLSHLWHYGLLANETPSSTMNALFQYVRPELIHRSLDYVSKVKSMIHYGNSKPK